MGKTMHNGGMSIELQVFHIVSQVLECPRGDIDAHTPIRDWLKMTIINDETCLALNINISTQSASQCRTVGEYLRLVQSML
ncbi:hypothetical protein CLI92_11870 [Vandammella animalimorsus]|uniref:Uncharacterized protein n=3 Tax=Vandammella animalimorsus TaxID=2029117 RepID=A0A2A2AES7_9BURK|nr:hypothetical protein CK626_10150 [Vandammella animalimorsus]PAT37055.1 hypothetical protein CK625_07790 [Vandammella animalimorsus]PAX15867.1 hypothetical protein CLI92_11870 [Vandammella animalimorsus]PAX17696.1 hypothetical protein CLI93_12855 [Vandammella animalimorsus]RMX10639.1 hypothetical protein EBQ34_11765 [Vandammella animalimorsus]